MNKKIEKRINYPSFMPNYVCHKHRLLFFAAYYLTKASCEIAASFPEDFLSKGRKSVKNAKIMHTYAN